MNQYRKNVVVKVFNSLDKERIGRVLIDNLKEMYAPEKHPDVLVRKKSEEEVLTEFLDTLEEYCCFVVT